MIISHYAEPFNLVGEGKYNLNVLRETQVTESFLGLDITASLSAVLKS